MSLNLAMNAALSGMMVSQRGLDVVSQNIANFQTVGYNRKVVNLETRTLMGNGTGVQISSVTRSVHEGLLKSIRAQNAITGELTAKDTYYPRIEDMFGKISSKQSLASKLTTLGSNFQILSDQVGKPSIQNMAVQGAQDVTQTISRLSKQLQALRAEADQEIQSTVDQVNTLLQQIDDLNRQITRMTAANSLTAMGDLEDKRDSAINELSKLMDIRATPRGDGGIVVQTTGGQTLVDGSAAVLKFGANSVVTSSMTVDAGNFDHITMDNGTVVLDDLITSGALRGLLDMRDKDIPNLQANIDELSRAMSDKINEIHNQGTSYPNINWLQEGTRTFGVQDGLTERPNDAAPVITMGGTTLNTVNFGDLSFAYATNGAGQTTYQATITAATAGSLTGLTAGSTFTISNATDVGNNGTYKVVSTDGTTMTVVKVNPEQTFSLAEGTNSRFILYGDDGKEMFSTDIRTMMEEANYDPAGPWTMNGFMSTLQNWMRTRDPAYDGQGNATVSLNDNGKLVINTGNRKVGLAMRDQVNGDPGAAAKQAVVEFDGTGDGIPDQTISGLSSFFGLNDLFVKNGNNSIWDSDIIPNGFTTSTSYTLSMYDQSGLVGNPNIMIPAGSSLEEIAARLNKGSLVTESVVLQTDTLNLATAGTIKVVDTNGNRVSITVGPGAVNLNEVAGQLNQNGVNAALVREGTGYILRVTDTRGQPLNVVVDGGALTPSGKPLKNVLGMEQTQRITATVVNEGSGQRLRLKQADGSEIYLSSPKDWSGLSLVSELGIRPAATGMGESISVRSDILSTPEKVSRGVMQWDNLGKRYYMTDYDNTTAMNLAQAFADKLRLAASGTLGTSSESFSEYATTFFSNVSSDINTNNSRLSYQSQLEQSLNFQYASYSGVNMDEEVTSMLEFQRSYSASAKVITTVQDMMDVLIGLIR